jgi:hypothetical protein
MGVLRWNLNVAFKFQQGASSLQHHERWFTPQEHWHLPRWHPRHHDQAQCSLSLRPPQPRIIYWSQEPDSEADSDSSSRLIRRLRLRPLRDSDQAVLSGSCREGGPSRMPTWHNPALPYRHHPGFIRLKRGPETCHGMFQVNQIVRFLRHVSGHSDCNTVPCLSAVFVFVTLVFADMI